MEKIKFNLGTFLAIIVLLIAIITLSSYKTTNLMNNDSRFRINIPLKQRSVITTTNINYVNKLIKNGYVVQFVTTAKYEYAEANYTLILY